MIHFIGLTACLIYLWSLGYRFLNEFFIDLKERREANVEEIRKTIRHELQQELAKQCNKK